MLPLRSLAIPSSDLFRSYCPFFRVCFPYFYPRATRCGGDIVTLLWFRASVRAWFRPSEDLVNTIETEPLHIFLSNLADRFTIMRGWTLLILEVRGQRSRSQWTYIIDKCGVRGDATLCVGIFLLCFQILGWKLVVHFHTKSYKSHSAFVTIVGLIYFFKFKNSFTGIKLILCFQISRWNLVVSVPIRSYVDLVCVHVKLEKSKRGRSPSLHLAKEGDFARNHSATLILSIIIRIPAEILKMKRYYNGLKLIIWCITFYYFTLWILCWLSNAFSWQNSIQFLIFKEKMIGRKWGPKRGRFPLLGGRWMFRREMGSKRGSLPPKEGDLTCMSLT